MAPPPMAEACALRPPVARARPLQAACAPPSEAALALDRARAREVLAAQTTTRRSRAVPRPRKQ